MSAGGLVLVGGRAPSVAVSGHAQSALGARHGFAYSQPRTAEGELLPHHDTFAQSFGQTFTHTQGQAGLDEDLPHATVFRNYASPDFQDTFARQAIKLTAGKTNLPKKVQEEIEKETKKKRGPPLLWSPPAPDPDKVKQRLALASRSQRFQSSANRWRVRHTTPTFVEESLFGKRLEEPGFKPPWEDMKPMDKKRPWTPSQALETQLRTPRQDEAPRPRRPQSAGAALHRSQSQDLASSHSRPIWKP